METFTATRADAEPVAATTFEPGFHHMAKRINLMVAELQTRMATCVRYQKEVELGGLLTSAEQMLGERYSSFLCALCPAIVPATDLKYRKAYREEHATENTELDDRTTIEEFSAKEAPAVDEQPGALIRYDAMCKAIDAAYEVDEVKDIRDKAIALEVYSRLARNTENERRACEIRLRSERKAGQLARQLEKSQGKRTDKPQPLPTMGRGSKTEALRKAGVSPKQAEQWQALAAIPDEQFEAALADKSTMPSTAGIIRAAEQAASQKPDAPKPQKVSSKALWLYGRLSEFVDELVEESPEDVMQTMTSEMLDSVHTNAPVVARWLGRIGKTK